MKFAFIKAGKARWPVDTLRDVLGASRSGSPPLRTLPTWGLMVHVHDRGSEKRFHGPVRREVLSSARDVGVVQPAREMERYGFCPC